MSKTTTIIKKRNPDWEFPEFESLLFKPKQNKYCICVFVINEGRRIQKQIKAMKKYAKQIDIVVADGGSTDGSLEKDFLKSRDVRALLTKKGKVS